MADVSSQYSNTDLYSNGSVANPQGNSYLLESTIEAPPPKPGADAGTRNGSNPSANGAWRASPYLNGAEGIFPAPTQSLDKNTNPAPTQETPAQSGTTANEPWRGEPYLEGGNLPLSNSQPAQNNDSTYPQWQPKPGPNWNSPGPAPVLDSAGNAFTPQLNGSPISPSLQANLQQSLAPHYGFDGLGPQLGYTLMGGIGGALGKTVLSTALNKTSWWTAQTMGDLDLGGIAKTDFGPTETSSLRGNLTSGFVEGAAFATLSSGVLDNALDRLLNRNDHKDSWFLSGLAVPMAFSSSTDLKTKIILGVGGVVGGKIIDTLLPASDHKAISQIFAPTGVEAISMGAAWALPAPADLKLPIVGGTWLFNRMTNLDTGGSIALSGAIAAGSLLLNGMSLEKSAPLLAIDAAAWVGSRILHRDQPDGEAINDDALKLVEQDKSKRSAQSMDDAINKYAELGKDKEFVLRSYYEDYLTKDSSQVDDMLTAYRGAVTLGTAFGESRLSHGTTILPADTPTYILQDQNLDLGGQALKALTIADAEAYQAIGETKRLIGQTNHGTVVSQSEVDGLAKVQERINADIAKIYGKHDLHRALNDLSDFQRSNQVAFAKLEMNLIADLSINDQSQPQLKAKLFRDYALLCLTYASINAEKSPDNAAAVLYGNDTGRQISYTDGTPRGFDGAKDAIRMAAQLSPDNPDNAELQSIARELETRIPKAQQTQDANPVYNPLGITNAG